MIDVFILELYKFDELLAKGKLPENVQAKAESYTLDRKRKEFIASQWLRFHVLSNILNCSFNNLNFGCSDKGRPYLINESDIDFNISHSDDYVVIAIARQGIKVGIDIQKTKEKINALAIAEQYYTEREYQQMLLLKKQQQLNYFYQLWTHKEASLKLTGEGIANGLKRFAFNYSNGKLLPASVTAKKLYYYDSQLDENTILCLAYNDHKTQDQINLSNIY